MRFNAILEVLRRLLVIAAALLGVGVLAVIGNTIRLEIQARRAEIEVTKLVGGSNAYVRRPFLYTGVLYGLGGALLAWGIVALAVLVLGACRSATLARLYGSRYVLQGLDAPRTSAFCSGRGPCSAGWVPGSPRHATCAASSRAPEVPRVGEGRMSTARGRLVSVQIPQPANRGRRPRQSSQSSP